MFDTAGQRSAAADRQSNDSDTVIKLRCTRQSNALLPSFVEGEEIF